MNYDTISTLLNSTTDPLVTLEIASTWSLKEIAKAVAECTEQAASSSTSDAVDAVERLAILELCTPELIKGCRKYWDKLDAALNT